MQRVCYPHAGVCKGLSRTLCCSNAFFFNLILSTRAYTIRRNNFQLARRVQIKSAHIYTCIACCAVSISLYLEKKSYHTLNKNALLLGAQRPFYLSAHTHTHQSIFIFSCECVSQRSNMRERRTASSANMLGERDLLRRSAAKWEA
jgi:hypothetical protein